MLPAPGGGPGFNVASPIPEERAGAIDQYKKVVTLCAELGGKIVLYVAGWQVFGTTRDQAWAGPVTRLRRLRGMLNLSESPSASSRHLPTAI